MLITFSNRIASFLFAVLAVAILHAQTPRLVQVSTGWARNQINTVIFRRNSITSFGDTQFLAFYNEQSQVVLAKRKIGSTSWEIFPTQYKGDTKDAHKTISIGVDGKGYLHMVWNQHDSPLQYCRGTKPGSLELTPETSMLNDKERKVTYPEFYNLPGGDLLFLYRDGSSGRGNLVLNRYHTKSQTWSRLQDILIDGENTRSAYWQAVVDAKGAIHLSWVWRETPDVLTNHDLCYAKSIDGGKTWLKSSGERYTLPITAATAEYVVNIPQRSELINQTSMATDSAGHPYIVSYWKSSGESVPQYNLVYNDGKKWHTSQVGRRTLSFTLGGTGTRRIPISRPQVVVTTGTQPNVVVVFRDEERGSRVSIAMRPLHSTQEWTIKDLTSTSVGMWEPTFDTVAWSTSNTLYLLLQRVGQGDAEGLDDVAPQMISVLEWKP